jgi:hypothetical protein
MTTRVPAPKALADESSYQGGAAGAGVSAKTSERKASLPRNATTRFLKMLPPPFGGGTPEMNSAPSAVHSGVCRPRCPPRDDQSYQPCAVRAFSCQWFAATSSSICVIEAKSYHSSGSFYDRARKVGFCGPCDQPLRSSKDSTISVESA